MKPVKLFISYSWSNAIHEKWVLDLATELRENSVDVVLDKWDLKEGHDAIAFMEKMVTDKTIEKVLIISDKIYAKKADQRKKGVGTEAQIISSEIYNSVSQDKFVAIVTETDRDGNPYLPSYYKSRIYIDFSDDSNFSKSFEQLLRWIFNKPMYKKPALGKPPAFLNDKPGLSLETATIFRRTIDAIKNGKDYSIASLREYINTFTNNIEKFRIKKDDAKKFDDQVFESISQFIPYRNEILELIDVLAMYKDTEDMYRAIHELFERLIPYTDKKPGMQSYQEWDFDNFRFVIHEMFIYCIAILLRHERFHAVDYLLNNKYYFEENARYSNNTFLSFGIFQVSMKSLERRNQRLKLNKISLHSTYLKDRSETSSIKFINLMQADFILYIRACVNQMLSQDGDHWWPITLIYQRFNAHPFEIFIRAESQKYFEKLKYAIGVENKNQIDSLTKLYKEEKISIPCSDHGSINPLYLMNYEKLVTQP